MSTTDRDDRGPFRRLLDEGLAARAAAPQAPDWIAATPADTVAAEYGVPQAQPSDYVRAPADLGPPGSEVWIRADSDCAQLLPPQAQPAPAEPFRHIMTLGECADAEARSPEPAPVSDERIIALWDMGTGLGGMHGVVAFARAVLAERGTPATDAMRLALSALEVYAHGGSEYRKPAVQAMEALRAALGRTPT